MFMKKIPLILVASFLLIFAPSCKKDKTPQAPPPAVHCGIFENFETGTKASYAAADVTLSTGSWNLNDALISSSTYDHKDGNKAIRMENTGILTMNFDATAGAAQITIDYAVYGNDSSSTWALFASTDGGSNWTQLDTTVTASSTSLTTAIFNTGYLGNVRFQLRKLSGGQLNIDNFLILGDSGPKRDDNMALGNPSSASTDTAMHDNYLMVKPEYALSYNNSKGEANWVSWHLSAAWLGTAPRCDCFYPDMALPVSYYYVQPSDYSGGGFDRGHMTTSSQRSATSNDNAATFLMSNMMPQSDKLNQQTWNSLEDYCIALINQGKELYIISGGYGSGGTGDSGNTNIPIFKYSLAGGKVNVPSNCWKIVVVLTTGDDDICRINKSTRVIAVDMPNNQTVNSQPWGYYRTSVRALETITGYNFLSNVPASVQDAIETVVDTGPTN